MKSKFALSLAVALPLPLFATLEPKNPPTPSTDQPALVWDQKPDVVKTGFRNFRATNHPPATETGDGHPDLTGFTALRESGSSEFTPAGLKKMMAKTGGPFVDFDLRQECHGYINGTPVSWYATNNWANVGKSHEQVVNEETALLGALKPGSDVTLTDDSVKKAGNASAPHRSEPVETVQTEEDVAKAAGASYVRITVSDHCRPTDAEVDRFVAAVRTLPDDAWAHFHCRAGEGRTTTFMVMYDILRNARQVSLAAIDQRQSLLEGDYDVLGKGKEGGEKAGVASDRAAFVQAFYRYAQANPNGRPQTWSEWLAAQP